MSSPCVFNSPSAILLNIAHVSFTRSDRIFKENAINREYYSAMLEFPKGPVDCVTKPRLAKGIIHASLCFSHFFVHMICIFLTPLPAISTSYLYPLSTFICYIYQLPTCICCCLLPMKLLCHRSINLARRCVWQKVRPLYNTCHTFGLIYMCYEYYMLELECVHLCICTYHAHTQCLIYSIQSANNPINRLDQRMWTSSVLVCVLFLMMVII